MREIKKKKSERTKHTNLDVVRWEKKQVAEIVGFDFCAMVHELGCVGEGVEKDSRQKEKKNNKKKKKRTINTKQ